MPFFNDFVKVFDTALRDIDKVVRAPIDFVLKPLHNVPALRPLIKIVDIAEDLLDPIKQIERVVDLGEKILENPETAGKIVEGLGGGLETLGFITGQPELVGLGLGLTTLGGLIEPTAGVVQAVKDKDLAGVITAVGGLGTQLAGLGALEESENKKLTNISQKLTQVGTFIKDVDERLGITNKLLQNEIKADVTNNEQLASFIRDNHGQNEALKHGQVVLDNDLQKLITEEAKEEDVLNQIRTAIDIPTTDSDFVKDISNFNNPKAILEYLAENVVQIEGLDIKQLDAILDLALQRGVLNVI